MHPVKVVPTSYNPFVNGKKTQKTHSSINPIKTQKNPLGWAFLKNPVFLKSCPQVTFVPNFVYVGTSVAELAHAEKLRTQSLTQSPSFFDAPGTEVFN